MNDRERESERRTRKGRSNLEPCDPFMLEGSSCLLHICLCLVLLSLLQSILKEMSLEQNCGSEHPVGELYS